MLKFFCISILIFISGSVLLNTASTFETGISLRDSTISFSSDSLKSAEGKKLYESKCGRCHALHKPKEYRLRIWKENLDEMMDKAQLTKNEYDLIFIYLKENCKK